MKQVIIVKEIRNTKNPLVKQLMLVATIEKSAIANPVAFFLKGLPTVAPNKESRVYFQSVSTETIAAYNIVEGSNFNEVFKDTYPHAKLVVKETLAQKSWVNADGSEGYQNPKINPQSGVVLQKDGRDIYRNVELSLDGLGEDIYIQHDTFTVVSSTQSTASTSSIAELAKTGSTMAEPTMP